MRILDQKKINYKAICYDNSIVDGLKVASVLNENPNHVFKTLVTVANTKEYYVFIISVTHELDLKKCAKVAEVKSIEMIKQKELLPLTGYIHGGCSPIGMKKAFKTFIDAEALNYDTIFISAGKVGRQIEICPSDLLKIMNIKIADIKTS